MDHDDFDNLLFTRKPYSFRICVLVTEMRGVRWYYLKMTVDWLGLRTLVALAAPSVFTPRG